MIAVGMNGEALPREHGFPVRMVVPGLYGFVSACKWLDPDHADDVRRAGGVLDRARLGHRRPDQDLQPDRHPEAALDHRRRRDRHRRRRLGPGPAASARSRSRSTAAPGRRPSSARRAGVDYWRQWYLPWDAEARPAHAHRPGRVAGGRDPERRAKAMPFPDGSSGYQQIIVRVAVRPGHDVGSLLRPVTSRSRPRNPAIRPALRSEHRCPPHEGRSTMKRTTVLRSSGIALAALTLSAGLAACGEDEHRRVVLRQRLLAVRGDPHGRGHRVRRRWRDDGPDGRPSGRPAPTVPKYGDGSVRRHGHRAGRLRRERQPAAHHPGHRGHRGRPGRHAELGSRR